MRRQGRRGTRIAATLVAALLSSGITAASAAADTIPAVGVNDVRSDGILLKNLAYDGGKDLDLIAGSGVRLYRSRVRMDCVDPQRTGTFDFTKPSAACWGISYDALVKALAQRGITLLPSLMNFRRDAGGEAPSAPTADGAGGTPTFEQFAAFSRAAAARYGAGGSFWNACGCPPHPVRSWEVWNEQNNGWWWNGNASASEYATAFRASRAALRAADPQARAVIGGLVWDRNGQSSFVEPEDIVRELAAGDANAFDAVAIHPYTDARGRDGATLAADVLQFTERMAHTIKTATGPSATGGPRQPIWITEMGWSDTDGDPAAIADGITRFTEALDAGARERWNVGPVIWFMLRDTHVKHARDDQLGLRRTSAVGADDGAKPAWDAFVAAAQRTPTSALPGALDPVAPYVAPAPAPAPVAAAPDVTAEERPVRRPRPCSRTGSAPTRRTTAAARAAVLCLIDRKRATLGLAPLRRTPALERASAKKARAATKARSRKGKATRKSGTFVATARGKAATPSKVVARWLASPAGRARLLKRSTRVGVGLSVRGRTTAYALQVG